jgi:hypothetical protein
VKQETLRWAPGLKNETKTSTTKDRFRFSHSKRMVLSESDLFYSA